VTYWLTRALYLRALGAIYFVAFLSLAQQVVPLIGTDGLLPAKPFLDEMGAAQGGRLAGFAALPSIFWLDASDRALSYLAWGGTALSLVVVAGCANALVLALLWALYMSFVHVGQLFYGYGWEILLLEMGFLAIFLAPLRRLDAFAAESPPSPIVIWLLRWVLFRVMFGAGLIKLRGDPCWRDLTCMYFHYETQPLPNPLSWYLHRTPEWFHRLEVLFNHFVELVVPWTLFAPHLIRHAGGIFLVAFQLTLIISGNLSFLNWLTLALCIACFDDQALGRILPGRWWRRAEALSAVSPSRLRHAVGIALALFVGFLSIGPVLNLLGSHQAMNASFDRLHLVNTYGAFGSVGRERDEIILEGTEYAEPSGSSTWSEYEFKCKPGDVQRRPCLIAPYQYRVDWQIWFAAMQSVDTNPWLVHLVSKLLRNDPGALSLLARNPFPDSPPRFIRAELYEYRFAPPDDQDHAWWQRRRIGEYMPPLSADDPRLMRFLHHFGWRD